MKVPLSWLSAYASINLPPAVLAHRLTMAGLETTYAPGASIGWQSILVGEVLSLEPHPNADRLQLATVNLGSESLRVVCGAPNVAVGQRIAFARVGATLTDPRSGEAFILTAASIRGEVSEGMICSERELGLSSEHEGILILPDEAPVGEQLAAYLPDDVLEIEVTANRGDCLSILGVAHEVVAGTDGAVVEPPNDYLETGPAINELATIRIENPELCSRYLASVIQGVQIGPSPMWMQQRLMLAGHRPINNVVDVTNFVMLEYGQPLHAFDYATVSQSTIVVRAADPGEQFQTMDGEDRVLQPPMLLIADPERAIALAGVIGGANSEVTDETTDILLEAATFDAVNTRRTSGALRARTEASLRFEKGLSPELAFRAIRRATALILAIAGGKAATGLADVFPGATSEQPIRFTHRRLKRVLGIDFSHDHVLRVLGSLGFDCKSDVGGPETLLVTPPYWRRDVTMEDDLVEEVARITGYDAVPSESLAQAIPDRIPQPLRDLREETKDLLVAAGLQETISYSLVSYDSLQKAHAAGDGESQPLRVANPMSREQEYLRTSLRPSLLRALSTMLRQPPRNGKIFELGRTYSHSGEGLPAEREMVFGAMAGSRGELLWNRGASVFDFYDAKGMVEILLERLGVSVGFVRTTEDMFHPSRAAQILANGHPVGIVGELHPQALAAFGIETPIVACFELSLEELLPQVAALRYHYRPFSRFPAADRDLAILVNEEVSADRIGEVLGDHPLVTNVVLFDVYSGNPLPRGKKSLAYRLELQSTKGTLSTEQVNEVMSGLIQRLTQETGAELRS